MPLNTLECTAAEYFFSSTQKVSEGTGTNGFFDAKYSIISLGNSSEDHLAQEDDARGFHFCTQESAPHQVCLCEVNRKLKKRGNVLLDIALPHVQLNRR